MRKATLPVFAFIVFSWISFHCNSPGTEENNAGLFLPDDLEAVLWAESPMFFNPTNMDVDSRGRIWVTEAVNYRNFNNDSTKFYHHNSGDRVIILEDTDQDGKADSSRVFVEDRDLRSPVGIAVIGNRVIVSCSPNVIVYTDTNGDDKPDNKEIFLTGFGGFDHDHSVHAFYAGPDGNWYFNVGNAGPHIVTDKGGWILRSGSMYSGGTPYNTKNEGNLKSDDGKVWVGGLALRIKPESTGLEVLGHNFRNSYEVIPDSYGNLWQNDNDDQVVACRTGWLMEGGNAGYFSTDGTRSWQADQRPGQDMFTAHWHQEDPGVMPAGDCSGAGAPTGITMVETEVLGDQYLGMLLSADAGRNVIFGYWPFLERSGYQMGKRRNLITSLSSDNEKYVWNDSAQNAKKEKWFRPSDVTIGTDGAIYIADWYDPVVGGHLMRDSNGYGRIYRIQPKHKKLVNPRLDLNTEEGQLLALKNPAVNVRYEGFMRLKEKGESVFESVKSLLKDPNPFIRARAVWLLSELGETGRRKVENLLNDPDEKIRTTAFRALRHKGDILPYAKKLVKDSSAFVRREVAVAVRDLPADQKYELLCSLVSKYDGKDRWMLEAIGSAMDGTEDTRAYWLKAVMKTLSADPAGNPQSWNKQMTDFAWRLHPVAALDAFVHFAQSDSLGKTERMRMITAIGFIKSPKAVQAMLGLTKSPIPDVKNEAAYWLSFRQGNDWNELIDWSKISLNTAYERKLAVMKVNRQIILDEKQSTDERKWRTYEMAADSIGGQMLIGLVAENKLPAVVIPFAEEAIFKNPDPAVRTEAGKYFKRISTGKIFSVDSIVRVKANAGAGKIIFEKTCSTCHRAGNSGSQIGPDLTYIGKKYDRVGLLDAIINPDASIVFGYEAWLVNKKDGESLYGFLVSENKSNLVLKDLNGRKHVVPVKYITMKQKQRKSYMPDPIANGLEAGDLANVVEYLLKIRN